MLKNTKPSTLPGGHDMVSIKFPTLSHLLTTLNSIEAHFDNMREDGMGVAHDQQFGRIIEELQEATVRYYVNPSGARMCGEPDCDHDTGIGDIHFENSDEVERRAQAQLLENVEMPLTCSCCGIKKWYHFPTADDDRGEPPSLTIELSHAEATSLPYVLETFWSDDDPELPMLVKAHGLAVAEGIRKHYERATGNLVIGKPTLVVSTPVDGYAAHETYEDVLDDAGFNIATFDDWGEDCLIAISREELPEEAELRRIAASGGEGYLPTST